MTQIEFALSFKKQLENSVTSVFDYDTSMRIAMSYYEIGMQPRINLDDVFIPILGAIDETMYKYNF